MRDFNHSVNVLVKAYLNNTLEHGKCSACAVGNLVADAMNTTPRRSSFNNTYSFNLFENGEHAAWQARFMTQYGKQSPADPSYFDGYVPFEDADAQIASTGYSEEELAKIEFAFETAPGEPEDQDDYERGLDDTWMFNGLMAVVDVLADIHDIDLKQREEAKALFVK